MLLCRNAVAALIYGTYHLLFLDLLVLLCLVCLLIAQVFKLSVHNNLKPLDLSLLLHSP